MSQIVKVEWVMKDGYRKILYDVVSVLSLGIVPVVYIYFPVEKERFRCFMCLPDQADYVLLTLSIKKLTDAGKNETNVSERVASVEHFQLSDDEHVVSFEIEGQRYCSTSSEEWIIKTVDIVPPNFKRFLLPTPPYSRAEKMIERSILFFQYGSNRMDIPVPDVAEVCIKHALHPLIVFGCFAVIIWAYELYYIWASVLLFGVIAAVYTLTMSSIENLKRLREMAGSEGESQLVDAYEHDGSALGPVDTVPDSSLVVGDRILLSQGCTMPCDAVIISGRVVMDESMLTGESIPVTKTPIEVAGLGGQKYDKPLLTLDQTAAVKESTSSLSSTSSTQRDVDIAEKRPGNVAFAGTRVKYCMGDPVAVVYRTGFRSAKGQLISTLLNPREDKLNFFEDLAWVCVFMLLLASVMFIWQGIYLNSMGTSTGMMVLAFLFMVSNAIPVGLVVCLVLATWIAIERLREREIFVSDSSRVNMAGLVSMACFDKTGTLTEETLEFQGAYMTPSSLVQSVHAPSPTPVNLVEISDFPSSSSAPSLPGTTSQCALPALCAEVMATCHGLSLLSEATDPVGDLLEVALFKEAGWKLSYSGGGSTRMCAFPPLPREGAHDTSKGKRSKMRKKKKLSGSGSTIGSRSESRASESGSAVFVPAPLHNLEQRYEIIRHFEFSPEKPRSGTLLRRPSGQIVYLVKGSPESIAQLSDPSSLPPNMTHILGMLARKGLRVLAFAYKVLVDAGDEETDTVIQFSQDQIEGLPSSSDIDALKPHAPTTSAVENDSPGRGGPGIHSGAGARVQFAGLLCLSNKLKDETRDAIAALLDADVHVAMITGDHVYTALAVAVDCGLIPPAPAGADALTNHEQASKIVQESGHVQENAASHPPLAHLKGHYIVDENEDSGMIEIKDCQNGGTLVSVSVEELLSFAAMSADTASDPDDDSDDDDDDYHFHDTDEENSVTANACAEDEQSLWLLGPWADTGKEHSRRSRRMGPRGAVHIAVTGRGLAAVRRTLPPYVTFSLVRYARVFARAKPHDKKYIVEMLMSDPVFAAVPALESGDALGGIDIDIHSMDEVKNIEDIGDIEDNLKKTENGGRLKHKPRPSPDPDPENGDADDVLFCGDGANDMAALRAATVGLSLCDVETSIAAPVTSKVPTPGAVITLMREGRASIISAFVLVHYNIYFCLITLFMLTLLYGYGILVADSMFLVQAVYQFGYGAILILSPSADELGTELPPKRYFSRQLLPIVVPQLIIFPAFQIFSLWFVSIQSFYVRFETDDPLTTTYGYESAVLQNITLVQLMIASIVSSIGRPFREDWYWSYWHVGSLIVGTIWLLYQTFAGTSYFAEDLLSLMPTPTYFGYEMCGIYFANLVVSLGMWKLSYDVFYTPRLRRKLPVLLK